MYRYTDKVELSPGQTFLMVLAIVLVLIASSTVFGAIAQKTGLGFFGLFPYLIAVVILFLLYQRVLKEFHFAVGERALMVERSTGKRAKPVVTVPFEKMLSLTRAQDQKTDYRCAGSKTQNRWVLTFQDEKNAQRTLIFAPNERLLELLQEKIPTKEKNEVD